MTQPPAGNTMPGNPAVPAVPSQPDPSPARPVARRTAFAEGVDRLRAAAVTEPGRLRAIGAVPALLVLAFGATAAWQTAGRAAAADDVLHRGRPLSAHAAGIHRSLADADTMASSGCLAGRQEGRTTRERYEAGIRTAAAELVTAAGSPDSASTAVVAKLNQPLPRYKGLVKTARADNRQGFPVGGAYPRTADDLMQRQMLPAAQELYQRENQRLRTDHGHAVSWPWAAIALGVLALAVLGWAQYRTYRRTNRVLTRGLVAATAATVAALLWLVCGHALARAGLTASDTHGVRSPARAASLADDTAGRRPVREAQAAVKEWTSRHTRARQADDAGDYRTARDRIIGMDADTSTSVSFEAVDRALASAIAHETRDFEQAARGGRGALTGLPAGASVLAVLGAAGAVLGAGRRLSEYR